MRVRAARAYTRFLILGLVKARVRAPRVRVASVVYMCTYVCSLARAH